MGLSAGAGVGMLSPMLPKALVLGLDLDPDGENVSLGSRRAAALTSTLAPELGAKVVLLHSFDEQRDSFVGDGGELESQPLAGAVLALEALADSLRDRGVEVEVVLTEERPATELIRRATADDSTWVILGKRSQAERDERRVGGVANALIRRCPAPVLALDPEQPPHLNSIVAATDLSDTGAKVTRIASELAERTGAELDVIHAYAVPFELQMEAARMSRSAYLTRRRAIEQECVETMAAACSPKVRDRAKLRAVNTSPHRAIKSAVKELNPDLLVLGTISKVGIAGLFVGRTAERLLYDVHCSILTVKPDGAPNPLT